MFAGRPRAFVMQIGSRWSPTRQILSAADDQFDYFTWWFVLMFCCRRPLSAGLIHRGRLDAVSPILLCRPANRFVAETRRPCSFSDRKECRLSLTPDRAAADAVYLGTINNVDRISNSYVIPPWTCINNRSDIQAVAASNNCEYVQEHIWQRRNGRLSYKLPVHQPTSTKVQCTSTEIANFVINLSDGVICQKPDTEQAKMDVCCLLQETADRGLEKVDRTIPVTASQQVT